MRERMLEVERSVVASSGPGREIFECGPFSAIVDPATDLKYLSYAIPQRPLGSAASLRAALTELGSAFAARERRLRFEFTEELWPELPPALGELGLGCEGRYPRMALEAGDVAPIAAPGVSLRLLSPAEPQALLYEFLQVRNISYAHDERPEQAEVEQMANSLAGGLMRAAVAAAEGRMCGIASTMSAGKIAELAGVATLPAARRRGIASSISSLLAADFFARGGELLWLSAGDSVAEAVYSRIGFRRFATHTAWSLPDPS